MINTPDDCIDSIRRFLIEFRARSSPFVISIDGISTKGCQMLDLFVSVGSDHSPVFSLLTKPSSIWQPLGIASCHHSSIHVHWPINQCARIFERCSDPAEGSLEVDAFCADYKRATGVEVCMAQPKPNISGSASWFVLPFDFVIGNAGVQAINWVCVPLGVLRFFDRIMVKWSLSDKYLMHKLRSA